VIGLKAKNSRPNKVQRQAVFGAPFFVDKDGRVRASESVRASQFCTLEVHTMNWQVPPDNADVVALGGTRAGLHTSHRIPLCTSLLSAVRCYVC